MRRIGLLAGVIGLAVVASGSTAQVFTPHGNDREAMKIVERDWCDLARYAWARALGHLTHEMRRNLFEAAILVRRHRNGCALAEAVAGERPETIRQHAPWLRRQANGPCPRGILPLRPGDTARALRFAASGIDRRERPVVVHVNDRDRAGNVRYACGAIARRRSVVVNFSLTGELPSGSLSEHVVAVAHFRRYGWRTWLLLH